MFYVDLIWQTKINRWCNKKVRD